VLHTDGGVAADLQELITKLQTEKVITYLYYYIYDVSIWMCIYRYVHNWILSSHQATDREGAETENLYAILKVCLMVTDRDFPFDVDLADVDYRGQQC
jgi:hypothetical protein